MGIGANMRDAKNPFPKNELQKKYYILAALSAEEHGAFKKVIIFVSSVRSSNSHPDLLLTHPTTTPLFQITPVLNTGLSLSEPLQLYKGYDAI